MVGGCAICIDGRCVAEDDRDGQGFNRECMDGCAEGFFAKIFTMITVERTFDVCCKVSRRGRFAFLSSTLNPHSEVILLNASQG